MLSPFPCNNPVIREYSWKKTQIKEQQKQADRFFPRQDFESEQKYENLTIAD